ncbi:MAG: o-succinylbenzoate synthase, partial [Nocardioidaceae bacterium]
IKESIDETLAEVDSRVDEGYRRIKLKIRRGWDVELVRAVRDSFPELVLTVDANASYSVDDVATFMRLDEFGLLCIEQPLGYDDIEGSAWLQARLTTPVCLDEAVTSPRAARLALDNDACRNVNLKPSRVGGVTAAREIHDLCVERGIPLWCGGMLESGIGRASNIALCSLPGFVQPADMSPAHVLYTEDVVDPTFDIDSEGYVAVPTMPGLGFNVASDRLRERTIQRSDWDPEEERMVTSVLESEGVL